MATATTSLQHTDFRTELWYMGGRMTIHADSHATNGSFALIEFEGAPGMEPPLHIHEREDEMFYVLEGSLQVTRGVEQLILGPGQSGFLPRGIPHTFKILSDSVRALGVITPGGFEEFFKGMGRPAEGPGPDPNPSAPDVPKMIGLCEKLGVHFMR